MNTESARSSNNEAHSLDALLNEHFQGKVVRKDLTKFLKSDASDARGHYVAS